MKRILTAWLLALALVMTGALALAEMPTEDRAGNPIAIPQSVETIISLVPSITQVIVDTGAGDKLVGIDTYSVGIEGLAADLPVFDMMTPDMERMVVLAPDVIFINDMTLFDKPDAFDPVVAEGSCVVLVPSSSSIEAILEDVAFIGKVIGKEDAALALNRTLEGLIDALRVETDEPVPVFFEIGFPYTFGGDTFLNEMIEILGGRNIFADQSGWITASDEAVVAAAPEIIFTNADWNPAAVEEILARPGWDSIPAVQNGDVYLIEGNASSQPNHRIVIALVEMAKAFGK